MIREQKQKMIQKKRFCEMKKDVSWRRNWFCINWIFLFNCASKRWFSLIRFCFLTIALRWRRSNSTIFCQTNSFCLRDIEWKIDKTTSKNDYTEVFKISMIYMLWKDDWNINWKFLSNYYHTNSKKKKLRKKCQQFANNFFTLNVWRNWRIF